MKSLGDRLREEGWDFEFFQAVRLLENQWSGRPKVGEGGPYVEETVRIRPSRGLGFPPGDIRRIELVEEGDERHPRQVWRVTQNFLGLYGVNSPLPSYIPLMIAQGYADPDPLRDFLDIFNHRLGSLYYRAWKKHQISALVDPMRPDRLTAAFLDLLGQDPDLGREGWEVAPERLVRYAGLLLGGNRPPGGLETIVSDFFGLPEARVETFLPREVRLSSEDRSRVGLTAGRHNRLGESFILGDRVRDVAGQFRLILGPLSREEFLAFLPGGEAFAELVFLVRLYTRHSLDFQIKLLLRSEEVEPLALSSVRKSHALGRYSWMGRPLEPICSAKFYPPEQAG